MLARGAALALATLLLAGCGAPRAGPPTKVIDRVLANAPGSAQPSSIVATDLAFARAAKEDGQWTAFRAFAAPGALLHGRNGTVQAGPFLSQRADPPVPVQWAPRTVVMSCDGAIAASLGRFRDPEGMVGNYVTIWQRQADRSYKWIYDSAGPDVPQPAPRKPVEDGNIVVTAIDAVQGLVATCPRGDSEIAPPPALPAASEYPGNAQLSRDGTLRWRWEHRPDGEKFVAVEYWYNGAWVIAIEESLVSPPAG